MKIWKTIAGLAAVLGLTLGLAACNGSSPHLVSISAAAAKPSVAIGATDQVTVTGTKSNGKTVDKTMDATFTSSAASIATVNGAGLVTGVAPGTATITADVKGKTSSVTITVVASAVQVLHASPDAPKVDVLVDGAKAISNLDFGQGSSLALLPPGAHSVTVQAQTPGSPTTVIGPANLSLDASTQYIVIAEGAVANLAPVIFTRPLTPVASGQARVQVFHAAPNAPAVDVYVTAPGASLAGASPLGSFSFKGTIGPASVPAGSYQIRVTVAGKPAQVVFDSGSVALAAGADLLVAAVQNTGPGSAPITLAVTDSAGKNSKIVDVSTPATVRVIHDTADAPAVSVYANANFTTPVVASLSFPNFTADLPILPASSVTSVQVTPAGNPGTVVINAPVTLNAGMQYSVYAVGTLATIGPLVTTDDRRRLATQAKVRIIHGSPSAGNVDIYLTAPGAGIATATPILTSVPFKADTGFLSVPAGSYDVTVTPAGTKTAAIGPATITIANKGIYTAVARDRAGGGTPLGLILLDDFAP
jgi:hypothetical protein